MLTILVIAQHCIVLICGMITENQQLAKGVLHLTMLIEKYLECQYANHNICNFETTLRKDTFGFMQSLEQSTNAIRSSLYQTLIARFYI